MRGTDELVIRVAQRRALRDQLSPSAYQELLIACRKDPESFISSDEDQAFSLVVQALARNTSAASDEELLDDEHYPTARKRRLERLKKDCEAALELDPDCADARLLMILAADKDPDPMLPKLKGLLEELDSKHRDDAMPNSGDDWDDVRLRPRLRVYAAYARALLDTARYRPALATCERLLNDAPSDVLGARHTAALAYARLEDEQGLDALDARFGRKGDSWLELARIIVLFKLERKAAALRALRGYDRLCRGGSYILLRPIFVDTYLPDRPETAPYSFEEATLAVHEADPIIVDVPDLIGWVEAQPDIVASARHFAEENGLDW